MKSWKVLAASGIVLTFGSLCFAGTGDGGGGDAATEMRVDEIRADILKWIEDGGAEELSLLPPVNHQSYADSMKTFLADHFVVIGAVTAADELATDDEELKVSVDGQPKTCRGFESRKE